MADAAGSASLWVVRVLGDIQGGLLHHGYVSWSNHTTAAEVFSDAFDAP